MLLEIRIKTKPTRVRLRRQEIENALILAPFYYIESSFVLVLVL